MITLESIYDPTTKVAFSGAIQSGFDWLDDSTFIWPRTDDKGNLVEWRVFDVATGKQRALFDRARLAKALESTGLAADIAEEAAESDELRFDAKKSAIVLSIADDLYLYTFAKNAATRLTSAPGEEEQPSFSPDGQRIAFIRDNDLYVVDLAGRERRLTTDGSAQILNGKLDWLYQEEVYGRGKFDAFWWSPDSSRIAFLQIDEHPVPSYTIVDHMPYRPALEVYPYPKAGDPNPRVKLFIARASGGPLVTVDNDRYSAGELLIVNVGWNRDGSTLTYQVQNREQTWLDLVFASPKDGSGRTVIHDTTRAWVDPIGNPYFLPDGSFLWRSERSGFEHLYQYKDDGVLVRQITNGEWEARELHGSDGRWVYFSGTERSVLGLDVYRIKLDGTGLERLSKEPGTHVATFSPSLTHYVDKWSDVRTPDQVRVYSNAGNVERVVDENRATLLGDYTLPQWQFMEVKTRDGFPMNAMMLRPTHFDPSKKYPVYQYLYAGPHAQTVRNAWLGSRGLFNQLIAEQGVIVWMCDNRTASGRGAQSAWPVYKNFGELELRDIEDGISWLKSQPYVDGERVMLSGWSFGGFMTSYALTHSKSFKAGIAGGSVTDWRDYDSIYTERYMLMPQNNPDGYRKTAPRWAAKDLHGDLLLLHGTIDDNVHLQNTLQFAWELQQNGKLFQMMLYPRAHHGVTQKSSLLHLQKTMLDFVTKELGRR